MTIRAPAAMLFAVSMAGLLAGCVERWLQIRSDPPGARVFIDGRPHGSTPVRVAFEHYGTRELILRHPGTPAAGGGEQCYRSRRELVTLSAPWYQLFPIDLFAEHLWPATLVDEHSFHYILETYDPEQEVAGFEELARSHGVNLGDALEPDSEGDAESDRSP